MVSSAPSRMVSLTRSSEPSMNFGVRPQRADLDVRRQARLADRRPPHRTPWPTSTMLACCTLNTSSDTERMPLTREIDVFFGLAVDDVGDLVQVHRRARPGSRR